MVNFSRADPNHTSANYSNFSNQSTNKISTHAHYCKIQEAAKVIFLALLSIPLIYSNGLCFACGMLLGFSRTSKIDETVETITRIWLDHPIIMGVGTAAFYLLSSPALVIGAASIVVGVHIGKVLLDYTDPLSEKKVQKPTVLS